MTWRTIVEVQIAVVATFVCASVAEDGKFKNDDLEITFAPVKRLCAVGSEVQVRYSITCVRGIMGYMNESGAPVQLRFELKDGNGKPVPETALDYPAPLHIKPEEQYKWVPGEAAEFSCDLAQLFNLKHPGEYTIIATWDLAPIQEFPIRILATERASVMDVASRGARVHRYPKYFGIQDHVAIECRLETFVPAEPRDAKFTELRIHEYSVDKKVPIPLDLRHCEEREFTVANAELDYLWQLWTPLKSGKEMALLVWNLREGRVRTVIPWSKHEIEMGSTWATRSSRTGRVVIAGVPGTVKPSTSTVQDYVYTPPKK